MEGQGAAADASLAAVDRVASEMKRGRASFQCVQVDPSVACSIIVCQIVTYIAYNSHIQVVPETAEL